MTGVILGVIAAAGAGLQYSASVSAAKTNETLSLANAQSATQAARNQGQMQAAQAQLQAIQDGKGQEAAYANAAGIRQSTEADSRRAQENIRRSRQDFARAMSRQRAAVAARGVVDTTGSPLELLVKASEDEQLYEEEQRYADEISRRQGFRAADLEHVRGDTAGIDQGLSLLSAAAARSDAQLKQSQVKLDLFASRANSTAMRNSATAGLISSAGSIGRDMYQYRKTAPKSTSQNIA